MERAKYGQRLGLWFQAAKYLAVGGTTALLELLLFQFLHAGLKWNIPASNVSAVAIATMANFCLNRNITFQSTSNPLRSTVLYAALFLFNMTFSTLVIMLAESLGIPGILGKAAAMACTITWNFFLYKKVVFK